jgi:REP element-mobilizing transposase RayT
MRGHDYGQGGAYFVTVCAHRGACIFGTVIDSTIHANDAGAMVEATWHEASTVCRGVTSISFQLMPNHIHGFVEIAGGPRGAPPPTPLTEFIRRFKTMAMRRYAEGVRVHAWPSFQERMWQRNYYEHLVRDDHARDRILRYIAANPANWASDPENPAAAAPSVR